MRLNLRNRFLLSTLSLIILGMGVSTAIFYVLAQKMLKGNTVAQLRQITELTDQRITAYVKDRKSDIKNWCQQRIFQMAVQDTFIGKSSRVSANRRLSSIFKESGYFEIIGITDSMGNVVASSNDKTIGEINISDREYFKQSMKGNISVSDVIVSKTTGHAVFVISAPIIVNERIAGVLYGTLNLSVFSSIFIDSIKVGKDGYAYICRNDGMVIAHPQASYVMKINVTDFDFGRELISREFGQIEYSWGNKWTVMAFKKNNELGWTICVRQARDEILFSIKKLGFINGGIAICLILVTGLVITFNAGSIVKPINKIAQALHQGADLVASASGQVASASNQLSEGSSHQASAIEETSSSMEEMSEMTKQNASNANEASRLITEAKQIAEQANKSMGGLTESMSEISKASEDTKKIVKTIDEIAFQTNLLALNAAIEAARAGESGAGFAVVADEVRNLASRAAEAAKSTADMIDEIVKKITVGYDLVTKTNDEFGQVSAVIGKFRILGAEIATASEEQAQRIGQINRAVSEMDSLTQQNAANAQESASASQEMSAQAEQMKACVVELVSLVEGNSGERRHMKFL